MPVLRVRTKDGTERLTVPAGATLGDVRAQIENELKVPRTQATLARSDQTGPVAKKGAPFALSDDLLPLSALGVANGDMVFLDYTMERENQAHYVEKDPFKTLVSEGELRQQGKDKWTLTDFMLYRSSKEFVLGAPPEPHAKFVQTDQRATQAFINYMIATGFMQKRIGYLYGRWVTDAVTGDEGVQVHTIYEPAQECTSEDVQLLPDVEGDAKLAQVAAMLGLVQVGVIIGHPAREYAFTINEIMLASQLHAAALAADPVHGKRFVTMKARPVLRSETEIDGVATVEAYQMTDQCVELVGKEAFSQVRAMASVGRRASECLATETRAPYRAPEYLPVQRAVSSASLLSTYHCDAPSRAPPLSPRRTLESPRPPRTAASWSRRRRCARLPSRCSSRVSSTWDVPWTASRSTPSSAPDSRLRTGRQSRRTWPR